MTTIRGSDSVTIGRQRIDWADLRVFLAVAETGSFSAAAKALGITQPTASRRVEELEATLHAQLFVRSLSGVALTDAGVAIRDHVVTMERSAQAIERLALGQDKRDEGRVRLSAPDGLAAFWLAPRLAEFHRENPKITISLDAGLWPSDAVRPEIDVGLQFEEDKQLDHVVTRIATYHYGLFASPEYIDLYGAPRTLAQATEHRAIYHTAQTRQQQNWDSKTAALKALWPVQIETNSSAAVMVAARAGAGIAALPTAALVYAPELVMLSEEPLAALTLWLVHHADAQKTERLRRVNTWLKKIFDNSENPWFREEFVPPAQFMHLLQPDADTPDWKADVIPRATKSRKQSGS